MDKRSILRLFFRFINRFIVVPAFRMGLGRVISNPLTGQIMVLGIAGRKTGKIRYTPVSYARMEDRVYCYQGRETKGRWYLNLQANPQVEVLLPAGRFSGSGEDVLDAGERLQAMRLLLKGSVLGRSMYGFDPETAADEVVIEKTKDMPVMRIKLESRPQVGLHLNTE